MVDFEGIVRLVEFKGTQESVDDMIKNLPFEELIVYESHDGFIVDRPGGLRFKRGDHYWVKVYDE